MQHHTFTEINEPSSKKKWLYKWMAQPLFCDKTEDDYDSLQRCDHNYKKKFLLISHCANFSNFAMRNYRLIQFQEYFIFQNIVLKRSVTV